MAHITGITGEHRVSRMDEQGEMRIHDILGVGGTEKFADPASGGTVQGPDSDAFESSAESGLPRTAAPDLSDDCSAGDDQLRSPFILLQQQSRASITSIEGDESAGVKHDRHISPQAGRNPRPASRPWLER